ncbi:hypothetical protein IC235_17680 [Hymenobacter sp. BT664]|uniref:Uncharacterized protein n=1 Tax=Hymenobacter montanus TaxID=2771359 RepID=A0A927BGP0_9BACT|nr:hypothetical protein [Hymenobacter montanus]MBD2769724.1 hypothetical protein [Hymenobacter montanus]
MTKQVFTKTTMPSGSAAVIYECYGRHYFHALRHSRGDAAEFIRYLMLALVEIDEKALTPEALDNMHVRDIAFATEVLTSMMTDGVPGLPGY